MSTQMAPDVSHVSITMEEVIRTGSYSHESCFASQERGFAFLGSLFTQPVLTLPQLEPVFHEQNKQFMNLNTLR